jgi:ATP-dependent protease HslVU (ClpYQ) peptidase subunit
MTVICARVNGETIEFAADRQTSQGYRRVLVGQTTLGKLHQANGVTFGSAGFKAESQWFGLFCQTHKPEQADESAIASFMLEFVDWMKKKKSDFKSENSYLIAFRDRLFRVYDGLSVFEVPEYTAIGSGEDYAIAALYLGESPKNAAETAGQLCLGCNIQIDTVFHDRGLSI